MLSGAAAVQAVRIGQTAGAETVVRLVGYASLALLVGGAYLLVALWPEGITLVRVRRLLWLGQAGALVSAVLTLGLKGASMRGLTPVSTFRPDVMGTIFGTHYADVLLTRTALLLAAVPLLTMLARKPERAMGSPAWRFSASVVGAGAVATHCLTGHAHASGVPATLAAFGHLAAATIWLGGLVTIAVVLLPRTGCEAAPSLIRSFSSLAEKAVALMALTGAALFLLLEPNWAMLPAGGWGRLLLVKLGLVVLVLAAARRPAPSPAVTSPPPGDREPWPCTCGHWPSQWRSSWPWPPASSPPPPCS